MSLQAILDAQLGHKLEFYTAAGFIAGKVVYIIPAGTIPEPSVVKKYYAKDETYKFYKSIATSLSVDRLVIEKSDGDYLIIGRTAKTCRFIFEVRKVV